MPDDTEMLILFVVVVLLALGAFIFWFSVWGLIREAHEWFSRENELYRMRIEDEE